MTRRTTPKFVPDAAPVLCAGGTVVCFATGRSLTQEDVDYCRDKADCFIAVNDAWKLAPWATVLYSSDQSWWPFYKFVPEFRGLKVACTPTIQAGVVLTLKRTGTSGIDWNRTGIRTANNSGGAAINLAVHLGAKRIVLLGYDMGATGSGHFFGTHPSGLRNTATSEYSLFRTMTATMAAPLKERGIHVVNASRKSNLDCFERRTLREVLPEPVEKVA